MAVQIASQEHPFLNGCATPKTTNFTIPRVIVVRMSTKEAIVDYMSKKHAIIYDSPVENEYNFEGVGVGGSGSEVTVM